MRPDSELLTRMHVEAPPLDAIADAPFVGAPAASTCEPLPDQRVADSCRLGAPGDPSPRRAAEPISPRLLAAAASLALHLALLGALAWRVIPLPDATATVEVELVNESEAAAAPIAAPVPEAAPQSEPSPLTLEQLTTLEPIQMPAAMSEPTPTPVATLEPTPTLTAVPTVTRFASSPRVEAPPESLAPHRRKGPVRPHARAATAATAAPVDGIGPSLSAARAEYGALVLAQIRAHKFYPAAALDAHESGDVGVLFVLASSGRIVSVTITRSSGSNCHRRPAVSIRARPSSISSRRDSPFSRVLKWLPEQFDGVECGLRIGLSQKLVSDGVGNLRFLASGHGSMAALA